MELDSTRTRELRVFSAAERRQISAASVRAIAGLLERLERELEAGDLETAAEDAHRARNETLLVGAGELGEAFTELERAARGGRAPVAAQAAARARELWPATRELIAALGDQNATD
jgi:HPt (histidine-containing phosphotransfer) domain-containing protein